MFWQRSQTCNLVDEVHHRIVWMCLVLGKKNEIRVSFFAMMKNFSVFIIHVVGACFVFVWLFQGYILYFHRRCCRWRHAIVIVVDSLRTLLRLRFRVNLYDSWLLKVLVGETIYFLDMNSLRVQWYVLPIAAMLRDSVATPRVHVQERKLLLIRKLIMTSCEVNVHKISNKWWTKKRAAYV